MAERFISAEATLLPPLAPGYSATGSLPFTCAQDLCFLNAPKERLLAQGEDLFDIVPCAVQRCDFIHYGARTMITLPPGATNGDLPSPTRRRGVRWG